jgi:hypothetical protein
MSRGGKRKRTDIAAADATQSSTPQPAKRVKKEEDLPVGKSGSLPKQSKKERLPSDSIENTEISGQATEKKERSKKVVKKDKKDKKHSDEAIGNSETESSVCKHEGHTSEQCWHLHPELKSAALLERKKRKKEKSNAKLEEQHAEKKAEKEAKLAAREAAMASGISPKKVKELIPLMEKPTGVKYQTKKMRRQAKEAARAAAGLAVQVVERDEEDEAEDDDVDDETAVAERASTSVKAKKSSDAGPRQAWSSSQPGGGRFLTHDPIFSLDEQ